MLPFLKYRCLQRPRQQQPPLSTPQAKMLLRLHQDCLPRQTPQQRCAQMPPSSCLDLLWRPFSRVVMMRAAAAETAAALNAAAAVSAAPAADALGFSRAVAAYCRLSGP